MPYKNHAKKLAYMKRYRAQNLARENARAKQWHQDNPERFAATQKAYSKRRPEVNKAATAKYRAKKRLDSVWLARMAAKQAARRAANPERNKEIYSKSARKGYRRRYNVDPVFTITYKLRNKLRKRLAERNAKKLASTFDLIGCSIDELKAHLQSQFKPGMAWNNYGAWHIDHVKPLCKFDLLEPDEQRAAFSFRNLQPLWKVENLRKGAKLTQAHETIQ